MESNTVMSTDSEPYNSNDAEDEVLVVSEHNVLSKKQKRLKLLDFLTCCPPPEPLHWMTFLDYIVKKFGSFYPENVIRDVFRLIDASISRTRYVSAVIDLNSDDEDSTSHAVSGNKGGENRDFNIQALSQSVSVHSSNDGTLEDPEGPADTPSSKEIDDLKKDRIVRKIFGDIYGILKEINESTSCRICTKLKYRLAKFQDIVNTKESEKVDKSVQPEQKRNKEKEQQQRGRRASVESIKTSYYQKMSSEFLTAKEAEKIREAILLDKLLELSYPPLISSAETQKSTSNIELEKPQDQWKQKSKKKSVEPDSTESCIQTPKAAKKAKQPKKRKNPVRLVTHDSTEVAEEAEPTRSRRKKSKKV